MKVSNEPPMNTIGSRMKSILPIAAVPTSICRPMPGESCAPTFSEIIVSSSAVTPLALAGGGVDHQLHRTEERAEDQQVRKECQRQALTRLRRRQVLVRGDHRR